MFKFILDSDTIVSENTFDASVQAVGCVLNAVDLVMNNTINKAFVAVRPPGHHAGIFGKAE